MTHPKRRSPRFADLNEQIQAASSHEHEKDDGDSVEGNDPASSHDHDEDKKATPANQHEKDMIADASTEHKDKNAPAEGKDDGTPTDNDDTASASKHNNNNGENSPTESSTAVPPPETVKDDNTIPSHERVKITNEVTNAASDNVTKQTSLETPIKAAPDGRVNVVSPTMKVVSGKPVGPSNYTKKRVQSLTDAKVHGEGIVISATMRTVDLLVHKDDDIGYLEAPVGVREKRPTREQIRAQIKRIANQPLKVLGPETVTILPHEITTVDTLNKNNRHAVLKSNNRGNNTVMTHLTPTNAVRLLSMVKPDPPPYALPSESELQNPIIAIAWAAHFISAQNNKTVIRNIQQWIKANSTTAGKHLTDDEIHKLSDNDSHEHLRRLLQGFSTIRFSKLEGANIVGASSFIYTEDHKSLRLNKEPTKDRSILRKARHNLEHETYGIVFFALPTNKPGSIYTAEEILNNRSIGYERQRALEETNAIPLGERMLYTARKLSILQPDPWPWRRTGNGTLWCQQRMNLCEDEVRPKHVLKNKETVKTEHGLTGTLQKHTCRVMTHYLMKNYTKTKRREYVQTVMPVSFREAFEGHVEDDCATFYTAAKGSPSGKPATTMTACCFVCSHAVLLLTHSLGNGEQRPLEPIRNMFLQSIYDPNDVLDEMVTTAVLIATNFAIPMLGIIGALKAKCPEKKYPATRCRWLWYVRQAYLYQRLTTLYIRQNNGQIPITLDIPDLCSRLAAKIDEQVVVGKLTAHWMDNGKVQGKQDKEYRIYTGCNVETFDILYRYNLTAGNSEEPAQWSNTTHLGLIAVECTKLVTDKMVENLDYDWAKLLEYKTHDNTIPPIKRSHHEIDEDNDEGTEGGQPPDKKKQRPEPRTYSDFPLEPRYRDMVAQAYNTAKVDSQSNDPQQQKAGATYLQCMKWIFSHKTEEKMLSKMETVAAAGKNQEE